MPRAGSHYQKLEKAEREAAKALTRALGRIETGEVAA